LVESGWPVRHQLYVSDPVGVVLALPFRAAIPETTDIVALPTVPPLVVECVVIDVVDVCAN